LDDEDSLSMDFVFWEDKMAFPGPQGRVGHPDLTQNIGQTPTISRWPNLPGSLSETASNPGQFALSSLTSRASSLGRNS
jgi:hypothetical protein